MQWEGILFFVGMVVAALLIMVGFMKLVMWLVYLVQDKLRRNRMGKAREPSLDRARAKDLDELIAHLFRHLDAPGRTFVLPRQAQFLIEQNRSRLEMEQGIQLLMEAVLRHMGLNPKEVQLQVVHSVFDSFDARGAGRAGTFQQTSYQSREIEVIVKSDYSFWNIAAIICHECAHYFAGYRRIELPEAQKNEELTDLLTLFCGFGGVMLQGYAPRSKTRPAMNGQFRVQNTSIGYLPLDELRYCLQKIKAENRQAQSQREAWRAEREREQAREAERQRELADQRIPMNKALELAEQLLDGLLSISRAAVGVPPATVPQEDLEVLQQIYMTIERGELPPVLERHRKNSRELRDADAIQAETEALNRLCEKLSYWNSVLSRIAAAHAQERH